MPMAIILHPDNNRDENRKFLLLLTLQWLVCVAIMTVVTLCLSSVKEPAIKTVSDPSSAQLNVPMVTVQPRYVSWAYSPMHLAKLAKFEADLYDHFVNQSVQSVENLDNGKLSDNAFKEIVRWRKDYQANSAEFENADDKIVAICSHPYLSLRMVKRMDRLRQFVLNSTDSDVQTHDFYAKIMKFGSQFSLPTEKDVENMMLSVLEIQYTYEFKIRDELFGRIDTGYNNLNLDEAYEIGEFAKKIKIGTFRDDGKKPNGLTITPWAKGKGKCLLWDATCADTMKAVSYLGATSHG